MESIQSVEFIERYFLLLLIDSVKYSALAAEPDIDSQLERSYSRSSILNSIIMLESISNILIDTIPNSQVRNDLDKLPFLTKFDVYLMYKNKSQIDRGRSEVQVISELKTIRDAFVHPKKRTHLGARAPLSTDISFDIAVDKYPHTRISKSPTMWRSEDALLAVSGVIAFLKYLLTDLLAMKADQIYAMVSSGIKLQDNNAILSETELVQTCEFSNQLGIDLSFILPAHHVVP